MFNTELNNGIMVQVNYEIFGEEYKTRQLTCEELIVPLVIQKTKYENMAKDNGFTYDKYKVFSGWGYLNGKLPKYVPFEDTTYSMHYTNIEVAYENFELCDDGTVSLVFVVQSSEPCFINQAYVSDAVAIVTELESLPNKYSDVGTDIENDKTFNDTYFTTYPNTYIFNLTLSEIELTTGSKTYRVVVPVYQSSTIPNKITSLNLDISVYKVNSSVGD